MPPAKNLIPKYIVAAAIPYVFLALLLLTAILFTQQAARFAELALYRQVSFSLLGQVAVALLPKVLLFTLPMAVLAGIIIGFARMGSDSELVAMRAAGIGTWSMLWPALVIGLSLTALTTYLQMKEAPEAARALRRASLEGALQKLDSPVEPRTFNTELPGYVVYVRDGDKAAGVWGRVFLYSQQADGSTRMVTARSGRIDSSGEKSELVLNDAVAAKLPVAESSADEKSQYVVERLDQLRIAIDTGRAGLLARLQGGDSEPDEMEWSQLVDKASSNIVAERREGQRILHKRIALSVSPLIFALLGGALGLRVRRGGRGVGVLLSLAIVVLYYLISLMGESMARVGTIHPVEGMWLSTELMVFLSLIFLVLNRIPITAIVQRGLRIRKFAWESALSRTRVNYTAGARLWDFPSLLDIGLFRTLSFSFVLGFISLVAVFIIFTLFELWRFIALNKAGIWLITKYILFLLPYITVELFPATMLIAVLVTYALLARRSEAIAWWACGQSVYRLMLPGLLFAIIAGIGTWLIQERVMPSFNVQQDALRGLIKGGEARATTLSGRQWLASAESPRLYSYEFDNQQGILREPAVYDFDAQGIHLEKLTTGSEAIWIANNKIRISNAETISYRGMAIQRQVPEQIEVNGVEPLQVFKPTFDKPSQLSAAGLSSYLKSAKRRGMEVSAAAVALQRKYARPFGVVVMAFIGMPLALSFGKRGAIIALCSAVAVSIAYWGVADGFQQLGGHGLLPPVVAGWFPPLIFAAAATYFLSRVRT
jgi:lipopolysaccharide export system permease protein